jgi:hypothetical protein
MPDDELPPLPEPRMHQSIKRDVLPTKDVEAKPLAPLLDRPAIDVLLERDLAPRPGERLRPFFCRLLAWVERDPELGGRVPAVVLGPALYVFRRFVLRCSPE